MTAADRELRDAVGNTRAALKSLQRQARLAVQLTTDLEERLARAETLLATRPAQEAQRHGTHEDQVLVRT